MPEERMIEVIASAPESQWKTLIRILESACEDGEMTAEDNEIVQGFIDEVQEAIDSAE